METIIKTVNKLLPVGKKAKKYLPFFIGFKLLTFTGFLAFTMNRQMLLTTPQIAIALLLMSFWIVVTFYKRLDPLKEKKRIKLNKIK